VWVRPFLAGSYAELHSPTQTDGAQRLWFDCQDSQAQENIDILNYIGETGEYPPPTMKVTNFNLSLKRHSLWVTKHFAILAGGTFLSPATLTILTFERWCLIRVCVFIDAYALVHISTYQQNLKDIIQAVMQIANFVYINSLFLRTDSD